MNKIAMHEVEYDYDMEYVVTTGNCAETSVYACALCPLSNLCEVEIAVEVEVDDTE